MTLIKFINAPKHPDGTYNKDFKRFVNAVIQRNPSEIQTVRYWLNKAIS